MPPTVLAVDGNSLAHRGFHAVSDPEERTGPFVTGVLVRMLATAWSAGPFDAVIIAFDHPVNRRKLADPSYKAHREERDPELTAHLEQLPAHLTACGFTVVCVEGVEADDLLAATADACTARGWRCAILSSDRDLTAVVSEQVTLLRPRGSFAALTAYTPADVRAEYGIDPEQYTDLAALRGDPSDGLDGVKGIGPKTAARLLRDYGDVPGIYAALCDLPPKLEAMLRADRHNVERNLWLMAPIPNLHVDVDAAVAVGVDPDRVDAALVPLGLGRAAGQFRYALERPPLPPLPPPPEEEPVLVDGATSPRIGRSRPTLTVATVGEQTSLF